MTTAPITKDDAEGGEFNYVRDSAVWPEDTPVVRDPEWLQAQITD